METGQFNLIELYKKAFNVSGVKYSIENNSKYGDDNNNSKPFSIDVPVKQIIAPKSILGTPIYEKFHLFLMSPYKVGESQSVLSEYVFPDWPLMEVSASKNIVTTPINGHKGSVKEYINTDDYKVIIRGLLINYNGDEYPEQLVYDFHSFFKLNESLGITNSILNLLDVHQLIITDVQLPALEGYNNVQPYAIQCLSDTPIMMEIKDAKQQNVEILGRGNL